MTENNPNKKSKEDKNSDNDEKGITAKKEEDMPEWYSQVIIKAELADYSPIKGCMIIRPYGYEIWQKIVEYFDSKIKNKGVRNAYFPLFIPESFFKKEADHAEGFAPEVAWIERKDDTEERLAVRPTSETIIYEAYSRWIRSYRDLPLRINQWCNIVRWEVKDVKMFLRSREFLWQEGHCVYETEKERNEETLMYLEMYRDVAENLLAVPVLAGEKSKKERFAGADRTYTIEGFMPDGKALQMGTSHDLSQGFAKGFDINFIGRDEKSHMPYQNSWGISTRMIGAVVLIHGDDKGLVLPPNVAPIKAVIVPILFEDTKEKVLKKAEEMKKNLDMDTELDDREQYSAGWKFNDWEMKGVPLRIEIGPKDVEKGQVVLVRRDSGDKTFVKFEELNKTANDILEDMQKTLLEKAKKKMDGSVVEVNNWDDFVKAIKEKKMAKVEFCDDVDCEEEIKAKTNGATSRCCIIGEKKPKGNCFHCGKKAEKIMYFSKNY